jgi:hypothetical protein
LGFATGAVLLVPQATKARAASRIA